jgi:hypothetical protein
MGAFTVTEAAVLLVDRSAKSSYEFDGRQSSSALDGGKASE